MLVDEQNANDADYIPMTPNPEQAIGFQAGKRGLYLPGGEQPNGYTEPLLHAKRIEMKAQLNS